MTVKKPATPPTPAPKTTQEPVRKEVEFWKLMLEVQEIIENTAFSQNKGAGGSALKDSHALKNTANRLLRERGIVFVMGATESVKLEVIGESNIFVHGHYEHTWFLNGVVAHKGLHYGGFNTLISPRTNAAYAVHGSLTSATTDVLFDTLNAATLVNDDDADTRNQQAYNTQPGRQAVAPINDNTMPY